MGIFIGDTQRINAVECALEINYAVKNIIQPQLNTNWTTDFTLRHVVGIDTSEIRAARTGVRGDNDLVWIGNAANLAAKLTALDAAQPTWITKRVFDSLRDKQKLGPQGEGIWRQWSWTEHDGQPIYSSTYWKEIS